jgi:predicted transcriptional regulator
LRGKILRVLQETKPTGYTTALKMLQIMTDKGLVLRDDTVRPQIYRPGFSRELTKFEYKANASRHTI